MARTSSQNVDADKEEEIRSLQSQIKDMSTKLLLAADKNADLEDEIRVVRSNATLATLRCDALEEAFERSGQTDFGGNGVGTAGAGTSFLGRKPIKPKTLREMLGWKSTGLKTGSGSGSGSLDGVGMVRSASEHTGLSNGTSDLPLGNVEEMDPETLRRTIKIEHSLRKRAEKQVLEMQDELESLSQSLFEEANNMVAEARKESHRAKEEIAGLQKALEVARSSPRSKSSQKTPPPRLEIPRKIDEGRHAGRLGSIPKTSPITLSPLDPSYSGPLSSKSTKLDLLMSDLELMMGQPTSRPRTAN